MSDGFLRELLRPRFRGTLLGLAVGDALGFPFEGSSPHYMEALGDDLTASFQRHRSGYFPAGQYSDDTQLTIATVQALLEVGDVDGERIAATFLPLWRENRIIGRGAGCTEAMQRLASGAADWQSCGCEEGRAGNGAAMRAAPIGLWDFDDGETLLRHVELVSRITHNDARAIAGAAAVAAAVAYNLTHREVILGELLDAVQEAVGAFHDPLAAALGRLPTLLSRRRARAIEDILSTDREDTARESREGVSGFVVPTVLLAFYGFLRHPNDYAGAVRECLLAGGDVDTTASICGALSGSHLGERGVPPALLSTLVDRALIQGLADRLYHQKEEVRQRARRAEV